MSATFTNTWALVQKELKHYFVSPIAYVVMMIFLTLSGYFFHTRIFQFSQLYRYRQYMMQMTKNPEMMMDLNLNSMVIAPVLFNMIFIFLFVLPLIMMRSFADEKRQRTDELLFTSPISINQLVAGKFLGSFIFVLTLLIPTVAYQALLFWFAKPEVGPVLTGYLGIFLFAGAGVTIGLFASTLTENQIISAVVTFVILLFMFIISFLGQQDDNTLFQAVAYLSVTEHMKNLLRGLIDTRDLVYFGSIILLFLFLTKRSLESVRWR